eukprot:7502865-Pyramimonas_sp.AAC.1
MQGGGPSSGAVRRTRRRAAVVAWALGPRRPEILGVGPKGPRGQSPHVPRALRHAGRRTFLEACIILG